MLTNLYELAVQMPIGVLDKLVLRDRMKLEDVIQEAVDEVRDNQHMDFTPEQYANFPNDVRRAWEKHQMELASSTPQSSNAFKIAGGRIPRRNKDILSRKDLAAGEGVQLRLDQ